MEETFLLPMEINIDFFLQFRMGKVNYDKCGAR